MSCGYYDYGFSWKTEKDSDILNSSLVFKDFSENIKRTLGVGNAVNNTLLAELEIQVFEKLFRPGPQLPVLVHIVLYTSCLAFSAE